MWRNYVAKLCTRWYTPVALYEPSAKGVRGSINCPESKESKGWLLLYVSIIQITHVGFDVPIDPIDPTGSVA